MAAPVSADPGRDRRRRRGGWLWWLLLLLAAVIALIIVLAARGCGSDNDNGKSNNNGQTATNGGAGTTTSAASNGSGSGGSATGIGALTSRSANLLGRSPTALARFVGKPVSGRAVKVVSVVGDEVFWVGSSNSDRQRPCACPPEDERRITAEGTRRRPCVVHGGACKERGRRRRLVRGDGTRRRGAAETARRARGDERLDVETHALERRARASGSSASVAMTASASRSCSAP